MADFKKQYLDLGGLQTYDAKIKEYIGNEDEKLLKGVTVNGVEATIADQIASVEVKAENIEYKGNTAPTGEPSNAQSVKKAIEDLEAALGEGGSVADQIKTEIEKLNKTDTAVEGKVVKSVSEENGVITVSRDFLAATDIQIVKATEGLDATSLAEYTLQNGEGTQLGAKIVIPKDKSLEGVTMVKDWNDNGEAKTGLAFEFTYNTATGGQDKVYLDTADLLYEAEFKDGLKVANGEVSVKIDSTQEKVKIKNVTGIEGQEGYDDGTVEVLSVSNEGVKVSNIQKAIDYAVSTATTDLAISAEGDNYVSATIDDENNKKVVVAANVKNVTANAGTLGTWNVTDAGVATLSGETAPTITGVENALMDGKQSMEAVKTYVDAVAAVEAAERTAKIEAAVKALDVAAVEKGCNVKVQISETDGKVSLDSVSESYATITYQAATATESATLTLDATEGEGDKLVKASDLMNLKNYADAKCNEFVAITDAEINNLFTTTPQA